MSSPIRSLFEEILREIENDPELRERLERVIGLEVSNAPVKTKGSANRRQPGLINPFQQFQSAGEGRLREILLKMNADQLKDIISEHALDGSRLAAKWKSIDKLVELIVSATRRRTEKGDVFKRETVE
jgi:hypothetical protein